MSKNRKPPRGALADPTKLKPFPKNSDQIRVVIETPKGSRNKYAFDPKQKIFELKTVLPAGMEFPYDFGFVPQTQADDGDPVDVLVLMEEPVFAGCMISCRLIGVIEGEQEEQGKKQRNDRLVAVEQGCKVYSEVKDVKDLPRELIHHVGEFFVNYHRLEGKRFRTLGVKGPDVARRLIENQRVAA